MVLTEMVVVSRVSLRVLKDAEGSEDGVQHHCTTLAQLHLSYIITLFFFFLFFRDLHATK